MKFIHISSRARLLAHLGVVIHFQHYPLTTGLSRHDSGQLQVGVPSPYSKERSGRGWLPSCMTLLEGYTELEAQSLEDKQSAAWSRSGADLLGVVPTLNESQIDYLAYLDVQFGYLTLPWFIYYFPEADKLLLVRIRSSILESVLFARSTFRLAELVFWHFRGLPSLEKELRESFAETLETVSSRELVNSYSSDDFDTCRTLLPQNFFEIQQSVRHLRRLNLFQKFTGEATVVVTSPTGKQYNVNYKVHNVHKEKGQILTAPLDGSKPVLKWYSRPIDPDNLDSLEHPLCWDERRQGKKTSLERFVDWNLRNPEHRRSYDINQRNSKSSREILVGRLLEFRESSSKETKGDRVIP